MSPDTASKTVIQPGYRAGRRSSGYRSVPVSPHMVRAVVDAAVLTGDPTDNPPTNQQKLTPARLAPPGAWTNEVKARWPHSRYQAVRHPLNLGASLSRRRSRAS